MLKWILWTPVIGLAALIGCDQVMKAAGIEVKGPAHKPRSEEIREGCQREFAGDADAIFDCRARLTVRELEQMRQDALERAAR